MLPILAICIGASIGALCRWGLGLWLTPGGVIPWGTLAANLMGGYLIGACIAVFHAMPQLDPMWRLLLITGFLGGLILIPNKIVNNIISKTDGDDDG